MADIKEAVTTILEDDSRVSGFVSSRIYRSLAGRSADVPYIVYEEISRPGEGTMDGGLSLKMSRFRINCWSSSSKTAERVAKAVRIALADYAGTVAGIVIQGINEINELDLFEDSPGKDSRRRYGKAVDFEVWHEVVTGYPVITAADGLTNTISGTEFWAVQGDGKVEVYTDAWADATISTWSDTSIETTTSLKAGNKVRVTNDDGDVSNEFTVTSATPVINGADAATETMTGTDFGEIEAGLEVRPPAGGWMSYTVDTWSDTEVVSLTDILIGSYVRITNDGGEVSNEYFIEPPP